LIHRHRYCNQIKIPEEERKKLEKSFDILRKKPVDILNTERNTLYAELAEVNHDIRALKNERRLCERILAESPQIEEQLKPYLTAEREIRKDYLNYER
jgi:hypothetical protein